VLTAPRVRALGLRSAWGPGAAALPADALAAAGGRAVMALGRAPVEGERFRRSGRESLWAIAAVAAMLDDAGAGRSAIAGDRTALCYVTVGAYGESNRAFIERGNRGVHFPYTAPAVVPAEVAIEFGLTGPLAVLIGGPPATLAAIWQAAGWLDRRECDRALVLGVETFAGCADLYTRGQPPRRAPLVETAACLWLERGEGAMTLSSARGAHRPDPAGIRRRLGESLACEPLAALDLWRLQGVRGPVRLAGGWSGERAVLEGTRL
jgi:hypothetical protein